MINYFVYRVNVDYDGFYPSRILERRSGNKIVFNWTAYLEALDKGDIVLVYFFGGGCKAGIFAIAKISKIDLEKNKKNVQGTLIKFSTNNFEPLIPYEDNEEFFDNLFGLRKRGAEISIPTQYETPTYNLLKEIDRLTDICKSLNILLPGSPYFPKHDITDIPKIDLTKEISQLIKDRGVISAYFIRPSQASWITNSPAKLINITSAFNSFKKGDLTCVDFFADALAEQIHKFDGRSSTKYSFVTGVPLCQYKFKLGETDRVSALGKAVADRIKVPYESFFILKGRVSRRFYKICGLSTERFINDFRSNLVIRKQNTLKALATSKKGLLLIDDVYTDGVTTSTIVDFCTSISGCENLKFRIATLGLMVKKSNIDKNVEWRYSHG